MTEANAKGADAAPVREPPLLWMLLRDAAVVAALISVALLVDAWAQSNGSGFGVAIAAIVAFVLGFLATLIPHEWGHYAGARLSGATAPRASITSIFPIFSFDVQQNSDRQFLAMSIGGNVAPWLFVIALFVLIEGSSTARISLQIGAFAFAFIALLFEGPYIIDAIRGSDGSTVMKNMEIRGRRGINIALLASIPVIGALFYVML